MNPALLVLAAGMGSRYGGLKQIDPIGENGETIIDFSIYDAMRSGFEKIVFVIRKDIEKEFREIVGKKYENKIDTYYVFQNIKDIPEKFSVPANRTKPWGTGHAILCANIAINTPFAVINGDDFYGRDSFNILGDYLSRVKPESGEYAMAAYVLRNTLSEHGHVSRGICTLENENYLKYIVEHTRIEKSDGRILSKKESGDTIEFSGNEYVSMNMFGFTPGIFEHLETEFNNFLQNNVNDIKAEFYIPSVVSYLIKNNLAKVKVLRSESKWLGITYQEDKDFVKGSIKKLIEDRVYPKNLWG
jgi:UTP-glucose-1-phosphate uridylyltransferase